MLDEISNSSDSNHYTLENEIGERVLDGPEDANHAMLIVRDRDHRSSLEPSSRSGPDGSLIGIIDEWGGCKPGRMASSS
jgi:hypothetical protein